jgi:hypothetical protein
MRIDVRSVRSRVTTWTGVCPQRGPVEICHRREQMEPAAEPTDNRAERDLRRAVIDRKLSCGNNTARGPA